MDFRFQKYVSDWVEQQGLVGNYDLISIAGAQKAILDSDTRETTLKQIELSFKLHNIKEIIMIAHQDCGAYGGSKAFGSWEEERAKYSEDLELAKNVVEEKIPKINVKKMILNFDDGGNIKIEDL